MAYFDSAKNRAHWQTELQGLMEEQARREKEGFKGTARTASEDGIYIGTPKVQKITFAQLEAEERAARLSRSGEKDIQAGMRKERSLSGKAAPARSAPERKAVAPKGRSL